jgi:hypothetical protein
MSFFSVRDSRRADAPSTTAPAARSTFLASGRCDYRPPAEAATYSACAVAYSSPTPTARQTGIHVNSVATQYDWAISQGRNALQRNMIAPSSTISKARPDGQDRNDGVGPNIKQACGRCGAAPFETCANLATG